MPPAFADSLLFTLAGALGHSARGVGTGRSLGAARIPVARLELGPLGTFAGDYPCHVMIISLLAWQQFGSKRCQTYVDGGGQVWKYQLPSDKVFYSTFRLIGRSMRSQNDGRISLITQRSQVQ